MFQDWTHVWEYFLSNYEFSVPENKIIRQLKNSEMFKDYYSFEIITKVLHGIVRVVIETGTLRGVGLVAFWLGKADGNEMVSDTSDLGAPQKNTKQTFKL